MSILDKTIVALDHMDDHEIKQYIDEYSQFLRFVKIGMEVFYRNGPEFIKTFEQYGLKIFLDLKCHDIPQTVALAIKSLSSLKIDFLTIHLQGGREMVSAAVKAKQKFMPNCKLLGVTYLTSLDQSDYQEVWGHSLDQHSQSFTNLVQLALDTKLDGLISSPLDLKLIKSIDSNNNLLKVTPGIRFKIDDSGDQKRIATPKQAIEYGSDFLVIGRSLTQGPELTSKWKQLIS